MTTDTVAVRLTGEHLEMARELTIALILGEEERLADPGAQVLEAALVLRDLRHLLLHLGRGRLAWVHNGELDRGALEILLESCEDLAERSERSIAADEADADTPSLGRKAHTVLTALRSTGLPS